MSSGALGFQPMSSFNFQNTNDFLPKAAPAKAPNEPMSKASAIFLPGQGSIPGTQQAPPTYNSNVGIGFTMQRENDFAPPAQPAMAQTLAQAMNVHVKSFVPGGQK